MTPFVEGLARKHCHYHSGLADDPDECLCGIFEEIAREALEEAEKVVAPPADGSSIPSVQAAFDLRAEFAARIAALRALPVETP